MSRIVSEWAHLNRQAKRACSDALKRLTEKASGGDPVAQISGAFLHKAAETLNAVNVLYAHGMEEPAQGLIRILFELRINFDCFLRMLHKDPRGACQRVADSMMLEKIKQARASEFAGMPEELKDQLAADEKEISARYDADDLKRLRTHGFTGAPVEQRANMTGHAVPYQVMYRNFSRNIHSTDYMESYLKAGLIGMKHDQSYLDSRDIVAHYTAHFSAVGILEFANHVFDLEMEKDIEYLGRRQAEIKALDDA